MKLIPLALLLTCAAPAAALRAGEAAIPVRVGDTLGERPARRIGDTPAVVQFDEVSENTLRISVLPVSPDGRPDAIRCTCGPVRSCRWIRSASTRVSASPARPLIPSGEVKQIAYDGTPVEVTF